MYILGCCINGALVGYLAFAAFHSLGAAVVCSLLAALGNGLIYFGAIK